VDVRGSMAVDRDAPVGFQSMECRMRLGVAPGTDPDLCRRLLTEAERLCINVQTLRAGVPVDVSFDMRETGEAPSGCVASEG